MLFSRKLVLLYALVALLSLMVSGAALAQSDGGQVRFVHAIPDAAAIDIYADGQLVVSNLESGEVSLYVNLPAGDHNLTVTQTGVTTMLWEQPLRVASNSAQTLIVATTQPLLFQAYTDDTTPLELGKARFTAVHAIPNGPAIDLVLASGQPVISNLSFNQVYGTLDLPVRGYDLAAIPNGGTLEDAIIPAQTYPLASGSYYVLLVSGTVNSPQAQLISVPVNGDASGGHVRIAHAIPDAPAVDVYFGDTLVAPSLAFGSDATDYMAVPAASYEVSVREAGSGTELASGTVDVATGDRVTVAVVNGADGAAIQAITADVSGITPQQAVINLVNVIPADATAFLSLSDGSGLTGDIPSGESSAAAVPATEGGARVSINAGDEPVDVELPLESIYGGVYYEVLVTSGEAGPQAILLDPASIALGIGSAPGAEVVAAAPEATEVAGLPEAPEAVPVAQTPEVAAPTPAPAEPTVAPTEAAPQPTATLAAPAQTNPTARVLLNPGANLQLRQYPNSSALSLGLAPSGSILIVHGRAGAPELGPLETPSAEATEWVDPVTLLGENEDLVPAETWINVTYNTPDGGSIRAWVNALYVVLSTPEGQPMRLRTLLTIPANRAGEASNTALTVPTQAVPQVMATVGGLDEGVNLQIRRIPSVEGESLALVPAGTELEFRGLNEAGDWAFVRYEQDGGTVSGWVNTLFLISYSYQGRPINFEEMEQRGLMEIVSEDERGRQAGEVTIPPTPTRDPIRNVVVATVNQLNPGVNLQLRRNPNREAESLGLIPAGTQLVITGRTEAGDWLFTEYEQRTGWIAAEYVTLSFNGLPYNVADVPLSDGNLSATDRIATATATVLAPPPAPTAVRYDAEVAVDVVAMTIDPAGEGGGLPVLTRGRRVSFFYTTNDGAYSLIELEDGIAGWVPSSAIIVLEPTLANP